MTNYKKLKENQKTRNIQNRPSICLDNCKVPKSEGDTEPSLRCCLCMKWHHFQCVGEDEKLGGAWTCFKCRNLSDMLTEQLHKVDKISNDVNQMKLEMTQEIVPLKMTIENFYASHRNPAFGHIYYKSNTPYQPRTEQEQDQWQIQPSQSVTFPGGCEWCGERNHPTSRCCHENPVRCHKCNAYGHKQKLCSA